MTEHVLFSVTTRPLQADYWHSPSYLYIGIIGAVTSVSVGLIVSLLTGTEISSVGTG